MGTPLDSIFFTQIFFQLGSWAPGGIQMIFFLSKVGYRLSKSESKGCFKLAIYLVAKLKPILQNIFERAMSCIPNIMKISQMEVCQLFRDISSQQDINYLIGIIFIVQYITRVKGFHSDLKENGKSIIAQIFYVF